jgi:protein PhnA
MSGEEKLPNCMNCGFEYIYEVQDKYVCPECSHEWSKTAPMGLKSQFVKKIN